ncbi:MAG: hypothetical protein H6632_18270 [Anaerolineales bacterium]|nr:hypothetical protein [Anaerolineales bacterium]
MSTDKNDKSPQRKSLRKLSKLGSRKPADAPKRVIEQVPNWLVQLLSKYGEAPGPLIGLEDPSFTHNISSDDLDEEAAQISALLEQMEEEGLPEDINQRASTSVEWGQYDDEPELPPGPLDDLLDSLGHDEDDYFQETADQDDDDWLTGSVIQPLEPEGDQDETFLSQTEAEQPDWLNDLLPADEAKPALQATFSDSEDSIPDWLNDALEAPATFDAEETVSAAEFPTETAADYQIPDWLTDALDHPTEPPGAPTQPPPPSSVADDEVEVPDWLTGVLDEPAVPPEPLQDTDSVDDDDIPDWLSQSAEQSVAAEASKIPPIEPSPDNVPDWLAENTTPDTPSAASQQLEADTDTPDWMRDLRDEAAPGTDIPDWLTSDDTSATPPSPKPQAAATDDIPDWLASDIESEVSEQTTITQAAAFDWLSDLRDSVDEDSPESDAFLSDTDLEEWPDEEPDDDMAAAAIDNRLDWLAEMDKPAAAATPAEPSMEHSVPLGTGWLRDLEPPSGLEQEPDSAPSFETAEAADTDWLDELEAPSTPETKAETETERSTPPGTGWLRDLEPPPGSQAETEIESSAERSVPAGTGWLQDLEPPPDSETRASETIGETGLETEDDDDWLAALSESSSPEAELPWTMTEEDDLDNFSETIEPDEPAEQASDVDALSFLFSDETDEAAAELVTSGQEAEGEIPDWLLAVSAEGNTDEGNTDPEAAWEEDWEDMDEDQDPDEEPETPDWLTNVRATSFPPVEVDEDELPDWLKEAPDDSPDSLDDEPAETLIPDWLRETPGIEEADDDASVYFTQDDEAEPSLTGADTSAIPDWLGSDPGEVPDWLSDDVSDIPDWLAESDAPESGVSPAGTQEAELEPSDWLMDLPDPLQTTTSTALEDQDLPAWLVDLPQESSPEAAENIVSEAPDWLSSLTPVEEMPSAPTAISTKPIEPSDEFEDLDFEDRLAALDLETEADLPEMSSDDQPKPAWLTEMLADDDTYPTAEDFPDIPAVDRSSSVDVPTPPTEPPAHDWLTGLRQVAEQASDIDIAEAEEDAETTDWDYNRSEITSPEMGELDADAGMPDWLSRLRGTPPFPTDSSDEDLDPTDQLADHSPAAEIETAEPDLPDWLADQPAPDTLEPVDDHTDEEDDLPDWLSELPTAAEIETAEMEVEPDLPDWLADQPAPDTLESADDHTDEEEDLPDWLSELPTAIKIGTDETEVEPDLPGWLAAQPAPDTLEPTADHIDEEEDLPDWLSDQSTAEIETSDIDVEPDLPDWLADQTTADISEPGVESAAEGDMPDWLAGLRTSAEIEPSEMDTKSDLPDLPDWLADHPTPDTLEPAAEHIDEDEDLPDWLTDQPTPDTLEPAAEHIDEDEDLPDWLVDQPTAAEIEIAETEIEPDLPDWLADHPTPDTLEPAAEHADEDEDLPDWLVDQPTAAEIETAETEVEPGLPDWLADHPTPDTLEPSPELADEEEDLPDWLVDQPTAAEIETTETEVEPGLPDWLSGLRTATEIEPAETEVEPSTEHADEEEDLPDWLVDQPAAAEIETIEDDIEPDLPDWLSDQPVAETLVPTDEHTDEDEDLPDWLTELPTAAEIETAEADMELDLLGGLADYSLSEISDPKPIQPINELADEDDEADLSAWFSGLSAPSTPTTSDTEPNLDMPDWFADLVEIADTEPLVTKTDEAESPTWLDDLPEAGPIETSLTDDDEDLPDWLTGLRGAAETQTPETAIEPNLTDWPAEESETPQPELDTADGDDDLVMPAWLADHPVLDTPQSETSQRASDASDDDLTMPDWLMDLPEPPEVEQAAAQRQPIDELAPPTWLSSPLYAADEAKESLSAQELETPPQTPSETADDDVPVWLAVLRETKGRNVNPNELRYNYESSDVEIPTAFDEEADESRSTIPSPTAQSALTADPDTLLEAPALDTPDDLAPPDWLSESIDDSVEPEPPEPPRHTFAADTDLDMPAWLTDLSASEASSEPDTDSADLDMPFWLADQPSTDEADDNTDLDAPAWLTDLSASEDTAAAATDDDLPMPAWLADQPSTDEADDNTDLDAPAWLTDLSDREDAPEPDTGNADLPIPTWLADQAPTDEADDDTDLDAPDWLADLSASEASSEPDTDSADDLPMPAWLADQADDTVEPEADELIPSSLDDDSEAPNWLAGEIETEALEADEIATGQPEISEIETEAPEADEATIVLPETEKPEAVDTISEDSGEDLVMPDWLFKGSLEELDTPEWLQDLPDIDQPAEETSSVWMTDLPELADEDDAESAVSGSYTTASERLGLVVPDQEPAPPPPEKSEPLPETPPEEPVALSGAPTESAGNLSGWLDALRTGEKTALEDDDYQIAETTGMLAGLGGLMPAESLFTPTTKKPDDDLDLAAQKFYEIATQPPQPAALPAPLSRRAQFAGRTLRAVLLLIFIGLIALPLLPATHKVVNGSTVPWTEPTDNFSAVLDEQRHQMISEQLGIVDVQQPGSVALVSFDYSLATQGEMQPLAQAVLGRLAGQGMRIIAVSLEPEGAPIAQQTIETILADRHQSDQYGQDMINLGYLPGQVAAVRAIANGRAFSTLTDYTSGEPFGGQTQADWRQIETIEQIDLVVTLADNPTSARWWIEQLATTPQGNQRSLLAATSAVANPFLRPYRQSEQLDGLISGVEGAAAVEAVRNNFGPARRMLDSQSLAHLIIIILIAVGTMVGWMPQDAPAPRKEEKLKPDASSSPEPPPAQNEPLPEDEDELEFQE